MHFNDSLLHRQTATQFLSFAIQLHTEGYFGGLYNDWLMVSFPCPEQIPAAFDDINTPVLQSGFSATLKMLWSDPDDTRTAVVILVCHERPSTLTDDVMPPLPHLRLSR